MVHQKRISLRFNILMCNLHCFSAEYIKSGPDNWNAGFLSVACNGYYHPRKNTDKC